MKLRVAATCLAGVLLSVVSSFGQTNDFGDKAVQLRGISSEELIRPSIPDDAVAVGPGLGYRPLYLTYRYYSCIPWLLTHVRSVHCSVPGFAAEDVEINTQGDNPNLQLVNETNESLLGFQPGTVATHPAYGLYCLGIRVRCNWDNWGFGLYNRFYVRFAYRCPYVCWWDHWWYYYRTPLYAFQVTLSGSQVVPPNSSLATGSGTLFLEPIYNTLGYDINYGGLNPNFTGGHIHNALPGVSNGSILFNLSTTSTSPTSGRLFGSTTALTTTQINQLRSGAYNVDIHSTSFTGGEIRGQIQQVFTPVYCPWRPSWIPFWTWGRGGPLWCMTLTHPYAYAWDPYYRVRPFCVYGLRYYFTPIGVVTSPAPVPYIASLSTSLVPLSPWLYYPYRPVLKYWPYSAYCSRWYWWQCTPFSLYRYLPPVIQYATYVNPNVNDPAATVPFPDDPVPINGTTGMTTVRALVSQQGDLTGDGFVTLSDLSAYKSEQGPAAQDTADTDGL